MIQKVCKICANLETIRQKCAQNMLRREKINILQVRKVGMV